MSRLFTGDCLGVLSLFTKRNAWITDPPANIAFMGRAWDKAAAEQGFAPPIPPRNNAHLRELQSEWAFQRYWGERFGAMYDQSEDDAVAIVWALPRTSHLTQTALRWAGWRVLDSWHHVFGQGWNKNGGHLKPAHEHWIIALKGKPELNIDAGRVPRGGGIYGSGRMAGSGNADNQHSNGITRIGNAFVGRVAESHPLGSHPPNFALSHHPDCVQIGERSVKASAPPGRPTAGTVQDEASNAYGGGKPRGTSQYGNGTESLPAFVCVVSCQCGRWWTEPEGGSPSMCECGRQGEWACPVAELDEQSGILKSGGFSGTVQKARPSQNAKGAETKRVRDDLAPTEGGASRFFPRFGYYAKASGRINGEGIPRGERHAGCEDLFWRANKGNPFGFDKVTFEVWQLLEVTSRARGNVHPTVKGIEMMMYLAKLSGGTKIGDLCFGSGGTAIACQLLGLDFEGAELCPEAVAITEARLAFWSSVSPEALDEFRNGCKTSDALKLHERIVRKREKAEAKERASAPVAE